MSYKRLDYLKESYDKRKRIIQNRLKDFKIVSRDSNEKIFIELCFCLLTPQSKAKKCDKVIQNLVCDGVLFSGSEEEIIRYLIKNVRFHNTKSKNLIEAREKHCFDIKNKISKFKDHLELRKWLIKNVRGFGMKEASHFMRNIGMFENIAILDRHILKNLIRYGVIEELPKTMSEKRYLDIEEKMKKFGDYTGISISELDLLFWSEETGEVFK